jgi:hypothetical protein
MTGLCLSMTNDLCLNMTWNIICVLRTADYLCFPSSWGFEGETATTNCHKQFPPTCTHRSMHQMTARRGREESPRLLCIKKKKMEVEMTRHWKRSKTSSHPKWTQTQNIIHYKVFIFSKSNVNWYDWTAGVTSHIETMNRWKTFLERRLTPYLLRSSKSICIVDPQVNVSMCVGYESQTLLFIYLFSLP